MKTKISHWKPIGAQSWCVYFGILSSVLAFSFIFAESTNAGNFWDDFNDGKADGWLVFAGEWKVVNGEYHMPVEVNTAPYPPTRRTARLWETRSVASSAIRLCGRGRRTRTDKSS